VVLLKCKGNGAKVYVPDGLCGSLSGYQAWVRWISVQLS